ncbi:flavoprotein-like protein [Aspergillus spinulosporus]
MAGPNGASDVRVLASQSLALPESEDDISVRHKYRPFLLKDDNDWVSKLELTTVLNLAGKDLRQTNSRLRFLALYGGLRRRSYTRLVAFEASRILFRELRGLSAWSDGHVWISPEQHGNLHGEYSPHARPNPAIAQVCGGSQSFNAANTLRILGRWMSMFTIPNQSSIPQAYTHFPEEGEPGDQRLKASSNRDRLVDCMEEFVKYTKLMRPHKDIFGDRFSEREERLKEARETISK